MILIAHKDDCALAVEGNTLYNPEPRLGQPYRINRNCTCGGVRIRVMEAEAHDRDTFKLAGRVEE